MIAEIAHFDSYSTLFEPIGSFELPAVGEAITTSFHEIDPILQDHSLGTTRILETYYSQLLWDQIDELCVMRGN